MTTSWKWLLAGLSLSPLPLLCQPARAAAFTANPSSDSFVATGPGGGLTGNNYGSAGALAVAAPGLAKGEFQSVLRFDLAGARDSFDSQFGTGQWSVQSLTLQLTAAPANNAIFNAAGAGQFQVFWMKDDSWVEGTGSPNAPTANGVSLTSLQGVFTGPSDEALGTFTYDGASSGAATYTLNISTGLSVDLLAGGSASLRLVAADSSVSYLFDSRNFGTAASRPLLTVAAVPEPGTSTLACVGTILLAGWRLARVRRRE